MSEPVEVVIEVDQGPPKWAAKERTLWVDFFQGYCDPLIAHSLEESRDLANYDEEELQDVVKLAGRLADLALKEVQYRFHKHTGAGTGPGVGVRRKR